MNYELSNILFVFPYFIEIRKNKILISRCCYRQSYVLNHLTCSRHDIAETLLSITHSLYYIYMYIHVYIV